MSFEEKLSFGQTGESLIARWLRRQGSTVLPVYEKIINTGKGPQVFLPSGSLIAPDLLMWNGDDVAWVEAKHKSAFSWHRNTERWVTGIDLRHYKDYCRIDDETPWRVWLMFLHRGGTAKDSPPSHAGLFAADLRFLRENENHRSMNWGRSGMVYWAEDKLDKICELDDVEL